MSGLQKIALVAWFYVGWFGCIYFFKWGLSAWSFIFPIIPFSFYLKFKVFDQKKIIFLIFLACLGILTDAAAYRLNIISFPEQNIKFLPYWLMAMWFLFTSVLPLSKEALQSKLWLAGLLGLIFGPLSYYAGETFQVLSFTSPVSIVIYALFWGTYFPSAFYAYEKLT